MESITIDPTMAVTVATAIGTGLAGLIVAKWALGFLRRG